MKRKYPSSWGECKNRSDEIFLYETEGLTPEGSRDFSVRKDSGKNYPKKPKKIDCELKEFLYKVRVDNGDEFEDSETFSKIINFFISKGISLEGKLSFSYSPSLGAKKLIDRKYDLMGPKEVSNFVYYERGMESENGEFENLEAMKENLKFYSNGKNIEVDSSGNFKIG